MPVSLNHSVNKEKNCSISQARKSIDDSLIKEENNSKSKIFKIIVAIIVVFIIIATLFHNSEK